MTEEEMNRRHEEIWADHKPDPLVQKAAWEQVWTNIITRVVEELYAEE